VDAYRNGLRAVLRDGRIDSSELADLQSVAVRYGLPDNITRPLRAEAFQEALSLRLADSYLSPQEQTELQCLLVQLNLQPADVPAAMSAIQRAIYFQNIAAGNIPVLPPQSVQLHCHAGENVHLETPVQLKQEKTVTTGYGGGYSGFSFRIAKGVRWNVGGSRGHLLKETQWVTVSKGILSLTNQRIAFMGDSRSFSAGWEKVMSVEPFTDALRVHFENRTSSPTLVYDDPAQYEVVAAICSHYLA